MGYSLEAIIAKRSVFAEALFDFADTNIVNLSSEPAMLPVTQAFHDNLLQTGPQAVFSECFYFLSCPIAAVCSSLSRFGIVGYVEADFFGGVGQHLVIAWENQQVMLGPIKDPDEINKVLRLLGIKRGRGGDEFGAVGLGSHRETLA